jgi:hypothetical protein
MKLVKAFGLAAVAAMVAMAFVGASSASAEPGHIVLCTQPELVCEESNWAGLSEKKEATLTSTATNPELKSSLGTVTCKKSESVVTLLNTLSESGTGHVLKLSFSECSLGETKCEVTTEQLGALLFKHGANALEATVEAVLLEGKDTLQRLKCGSFINCVYSGKGAALTAHSSPVVKNKKGEVTDEGGLTQLLAKEAVLTAASGFLCPKSSLWTATYVDSMAHGLFIES